MEGDISERIKTMDSTLIAGIIQGLCSIWASYITLIAALYGIKAWKKESVGQRVLASAEKCLIEGYRLLDHINWARHADWQGKDETYIENHLNEAGEIIENFRSEYARLSIYRDLDNSIHWDLYNVFQRLCSLNKQIKLNSFAREFSRDWPNCSDSNKAMLKHLVDLEAKFFAQKHDSQGNPDTEITEKLKSIKIRMEESLRELIRKEKF